MAEAFELSEEMRAVIGVDSDPWPIEITTTSVRAFARGVGYVDSVYYDVAAAEQSGYVSLPAPSTYMGTPVFLPGKSNPVFSHPFPTGPTLNHGLANVLDGGTDIVYERPLVAGDRLTLRSQISDLEVKESRALGKMLVVTIMQHYTEATSGQPVATVRGQAIYY